MMRSPRRQTTASGVGRIIQCLAGMYLIAVICVVWGFLVGNKFIFPYRIIEPYLLRIERALSKAADGGYQFHPQANPRRFTWSGLSMRDTSFVDSGYLLISRFSKKHRQVVIELLSLRNDSVWQRWIPPVDEILKKADRKSTQNKRNIFRGQHPLLLGDRSIVFHEGEGPLVRLDTDSKIVWVNNRHFHHSIEKGPDGNLYVPIVVQTPDSSYPLPFRDDGYAVVSPDGEVLETNSIARIILANGYRGHLFGIGNFKEDLVHLNDVQPVFRDCAEARRGDLLFSIRHLSSVFLYRPSTDRVIWLKTGPWLNQHDINSLGNGSYSIFGNDAFLYNKVPRKYDSGSTVYIFNPTLATIETPFNRIFHDLDMFTPTAGRSRILSNGDVFVEETDSHRLMRVSPQNVRWEYVNGISEKATGALHWSRYLTHDELLKIWRMHT